MFNITFTWNSPSVLILVFKFSGDVLSYRTQPIGQDASAPGKTCSSMKRPQTLVDLCSNALKDWPFRGSLKTRHQCWNKLNHSSQNCHPFAWKRLLQDQTGNFPRNPNRFWSRIRQRLRLSFPGEVFVVIVACIKKDGSEAVQSHTPGIRNMETWHTWNPKSQARQILFSCQKFQVPGTILQQILWVYGLIGARIHRELILPHPKESVFLPCPTCCISSWQAGNLATVGSVPLLFPRFCWRLPDICSQAPSPWDSLKFAQDLEIERSIICQKPMDLRPWVGKATMFYKATRGILLDLLYPSKILTRSFRMLQVPKLFVETCCSSLAHQDTSKVASMMDVWMFVPIPAIEKTRTAPLL